MCTSATLTVFGQGFDFFLGRVGLEAERVAAQQTGGHERTAARLRLSRPGPADAAQRPARSPRQRLKRKFPEAVAASASFHPVLRRQNTGPLHRQCAAGLCPRAARGPARRAGLPVYRQGHGACSSSSTSSGTRQVRCSGRVRSGRA